MGRARARPTYLAGRAGVGVDLGADRDLDDLGLFPGHGVLRNQSLKVVGGWRPCQSKGSIPVPVLFPQPRASTSRARRDSPEAVPSRIPAASRLSQWRRASAAGVGTASVRRWVDSMPSVRPLVVIGTETTDSDPAASITAPDGLPAKVGLVRTSSTITGAPVASAVPQAQLSSSTYSKKSRNASPKPWLAASLSRGPMATWRVPMSAPVRLSAACSSVDKWWSMTVSKFPRSKYGAIGRKTGPTREDGSFPARDAEIRRPGWKTRGRQRGSRLRA